MGALGGTRISDLLIRSLVPDIQPVQAGPFLQVRVLRGSCAAAGVANSVGAYVVPARELYPFPHGVPAMELLPAQRATWAYVRSACFSCLPVSCTGWLAGSHLAALLAWLLRRHRGLTSAIGCCFQLPSPDGRFFRRIFPVMGWRQRMRAARWTG